MRVLYNAIMIKKEGAPKSPSKRRLREIGADPFLAEKMRKVLPKFGRKPTKREDPETERLRIRAIADTVFDTLGPTICEQVRRGFTGPDNGPAKEFDAEKFESEAPERARRQVGNILASARRMRAKK